MVSLSQHGLLPGDACCLLFKRFHSSLIWLVYPLMIGPHSQAKEYVLQSVQVPQEIQGYSIQEGQRLEAGPGCSSLRLQAVRLRWSDQAHLQKEGQADKEDHPETRVHQVQGQKMQASRQMQDLRAGCRSHQEQGWPPLLSHLTLLVKPPPTGYEISFLE